MNPLQQLNKLGQSVWFDNIERDMLTQDELKKMIFVVSHQILRFMTKPLKALLLMMQTLKHYKTVIKLLMKCFLMSLLKIFKWHVIYLCQFIKRQMQLMVM